jgi:hypothetical protein
MFKKVEAISLAVALLSSAVAPAAAAEWNLVGQWRASVTCPHFSQTNTITIGRADGSKITGTTNVNDNFGKITAGEFDGERFVFTNKYKFRGNSYTETWRGKLSNGGRTIRGNFTSTDPNVGRCTYRGSPS